GWRTARRVLCVSLVAVLGLFGCCLGTCVPMMREPEEVRARILKDTPLGSSFGDVKALAEERGWLDSRYQREEFGGSLPVTKKGKTIGSRSLRGSLGAPSWWGRSPVCFVVYWAFDDEGWLIEVVVKKKIDAL